MVELQARVPFLGEQRIHIDVTAGAFGERWLSLSIRIIRREIAIVRKEMLHLRIQGCNFHQIMTEVGE